MSKPWKYIDVHPKYKAKIDSEDYTRVSKHKWRVITRDSDRMKVVTTIMTADGPRQMTLGKLIMKPPRGKSVFARRYQEGFDYRKSNLIICTKKELQRALPKGRTDGSSNYKGVSYLPKLKKWRARIRVDGELMSLGVYRTELDAAKAYNKAAKEYFGEIAYQNKLSSEKKSRRD